MGEQVINNGDALVIYCCKQGDERRFFTTQKEARAYARRRYDFEEEGIPFVYGVHVHTAQHICDELNRRPSKHAP